ncbi:FAD:protein FMN transferase [Psychroserpens luteolus]|uniref:FAD:protein FMN transferase n=1 Tax=Psychroserpens luteolus TaxID=2855840 RepID=UPI001E4DF6BA|nr:FAD:protein FMN transferase [Psychroserpens luteolus]MCD2260310.1 FAD:protein FMN transferase [Psychroserpens luteolus]
MKPLLLLLLFFVIFSCKENSKEVVQDNLKVEVQTPQNTKLSGPVFGTTYNVIYHSEIDYTKQFDSLFAVVNQSMSTYIADSEISKFNRNEPYKVDTHFETVFLASKDVYKYTDGAFDPTIGNVVNAWSFGADKNKFLTDSTTIDNLMRSVGLDQVELVRNRAGTIRILKPKDTYLEFNAIAKGYGVDVIGEFLERKDVKNYLVEIGGEIRVRGKNMEKDIPWRVGLDEPRFDGGQSVYKALSLKDEAMATSGTYRKFKVDENGNRFTHIINTKTGYPSKTNILSVSVITKDCMTADAYATAFQAMGIEKVTHFLKTRPEFKVFIIFENEDKELEVLNLNNFPEN